VSFPAFKLLTVDDIVNAVRQLPDKFSSVDPLLMSTLKQAVDLLAPFIVEVFNHLLARSHFPTGFKKAFITAMVKKPGIDMTDVSYYRLISNLPVLSKLRECIVVRQHMDYLQSADLLPANQSRFRQVHSTETAVLRCCQTFSWLSTVEMWLP